MLDTEWVLSDHHLSFVFHALSSFQFDSERVAQGAAPRFTRSRGYVMPSCNSSTQQHLIKTRVSEENVDSIIVRGCPEGNKRRLTLSKLAGARVRREDGQSVDITAYNIKNIPIAGR
jgi:hypothetical protein